MDVNLLQDDELQYELDIRNIVDVRDKQAQRRALRYYIREENTENPLVLSNINIDLEFSICERKYTDFTRIPLSERRSQNATFFSRGLHLLNRLERLEQTDQVNLAEDIVIKIRGMIIDLRSILNINQSQRDRSNFGDDCAVLSQVGRPTSGNKNSGFDGRGDGLPSVRGSVNNRGHSRSASSCSVEEDESSVRREPVRRQIINKPQGLNNGNPNYFQNRKTLSVHKWNIHFSGDGKGIQINDFLSQVKLLADTEQISDGELLRSAYHLFSGSARIWYRAFYQNFKTWNQLVSALRQEFLPDDNDYWIHKEIDKRIQKNGESFGLYLASMELLFQELSDPCTEAQKLKIVMRNMIPTYLEKLSLVEIHSIKTLGQYCRKLDNVRYAIDRRTTNSRVTFKEKTYVIENSDHSGNQFGNYNSEFSETNIQKNLAVDAIENKFGRQAKCFNCGESGHQFKNCKKPRKNLFCFKCGHQNVISKNCPKCSFSLSDEDYRPHVEISVGGQKILGLLDSGATCTILGKDNLELIRTLNLKIFPVTSCVSTADGTQHSATGFVNLPFCYKNTTHVIPTLIIPSISKILILGIDFWRKFNIKPVICNEILGIENSVHAEHDLDFQQRQNLADVLATFFCTEENLLGRTNVLEHLIDTGDAVPIKQRNYPVSPYIQIQLDAELDRMLRLDIIEPSISPWSNPIVCVKKPTGKIRLCLDSRKLNSVSKRDAYPLPHIARILGRFRETKFLSSIDLSDAFWQTPLEKNSREKTAFSVASRGHFQFKVMPFGLHNAPQTQCRLMDRVLGVDLEPNVFVYLDDIVISSSNFEEHLELLSIVAERLKKANLSISITKSKFCRKSIKYLGYVISEQGLNTDPDKTEAIINFAVPKTIKDVRRFLGMVGWYRRFINNFAGITAPISDTLKKGKVFKWDEAANNAFLDIKSLLISPPILANPNFNEPFTIQADASDYGVGAVLTQGEKDAEHVIAYFSHKLTTAQRKYYTTEKECLSVLMAIEKFRPYIEGVNFTVITDHASLLWLQNLKDPTGRLGRWALRMQQFDFKLIHRKGSQHVVPDALSRSVSAITNTPNTSIDRWYNGLLQNIQSTPNKYPQFKILDQRIYKLCIGNSNLKEFEWKYLVPKPERDEILKKSHDACSHFGITKTLNRVRQNYYWPKMKGNIIKYVTNCNVCQANKTGKVSKPPMGLPKIPTDTWQTISVDFIGPLPRSKSGYSYIFAVLDVFSKFVLLFPLRNITSKNVIKILKDQIFLLFGTPDILISDNGPQFISRDFSKFLIENQVKHHKNAAYHPQNNPVERVNSVILNSIRAYLGDDHREWDLHLQSIACAIRTSHHEATGFTPYLVNFGREINYNQYGNSTLRNNEDNINSQISGLKTKLDKIREIVKLNLEKAYNKNSKYYNLRSKPIEFSPGDIVWKRTFYQSDATRHFSSKLAPKWSKCLIKEKTGSSTYILEDFNNKVLGTFHAKDIKQDHNNLEGDEP